MTTPKPWRRLWRRARRDEDFRAEIEAHLALEADLLVAQRDLSPDDARYAARRTFGNVGAAQERFYDSRRPAWLERMTQHLRYAVRTLREHPVFAVAVVATLAVGIGFNTAIFTVFYAAAYRPIPVRDAARLVNVYQIQHGGQSREVHGMQSRVSYAEYLAYRSGVSAMTDDERAITGAAVYRDVDLSFAEARAKTTKGEYVSCELFHVVGVRIALGRPFSPEECVRPGAAPVVVISHDTWVNDLGGSPSVLGKTVTLNRIPFTVVGVAEPEFRGMEIVASRLWIPVTMQPAIDHGRDSMLLRNTSWLIMVGRLAPGASVSKVRQQLGVLARRADAAYPGRETRVVVAKAAFLNFPEVRDKSALAIGMILVLGGLVILMVCANVMNLLLARGLARRREIGIRLAVGASRGRLIEQLLTESAVLATLGGALGFGLAFLLPMLFARVAPIGGLQLQLDLRPDARVLMFSAAVSMVTAFVFGLLPALQSTDLDLVAAFKGGASTTGRRRGQPSRLRSTVVGVQMAGSAVLLIVAALFTRAAARGGEIDPGYATTNVVSFTLNLTQLDYRGERAWRVYTTLAQRLAATPGVDDVALVERMPLLGRHSDGVEAIDPSIPPDAPRDIKTYAMTDVSGRFFSTMRISLIAGRTFTDAELTAAGPKGALPAVVSEALARVFWPSLRATDVVGKRIRAGRDGYYVTGVATNARYVSFSDAATPFVYRGARPHNATDLHIVARVHGRMGELERALPGWASELDPTIVAETERFTSRVDLELLPARLTSAVAGAMGLLALLLAVVGIYGVVSHAVGQRGQEIAIRLALGATQPGVIVLMMRQSARAATIGLAVGILAAIGASQVLRGLLLGISPLDPLTYVAMVALLGGAAALACYVPSRQAAATDPARALRQD